METKTGITSLLLNDWGNLETYIDPWLTSKSMNMLYAGTGVGKTMMGLKIAHCLATASDVMCWKVPKIKKVLYIDGEMGKANLASRLSAIEEAASKSPAPENLQFITPDTFTHGLPNLSDPENFEWYTRQMLDHDVIIFDNLDTLTRPLSGSDSDVMMWQRIRPWITRMTLEQNKCILFIHHANKGGTSYGTSKINNSMSIIVQLRKTCYRTPTNIYKGIEWVFEKHRNLKDEQANKLYITQQENISGLDWVQEPLEEKYIKIIQESKIEKVKDLVETFSCTYSMAHYLLNIANTSLLIDKNDVDYFNDDEEMELF